MKLIALPELATVLFIHMALALDPCGNSKDCPIRCANGVYLPGPKYFECTLKTPPPAEYTTAQCLDKIDDSFVTRTAPYCEDAGGKPCGETNCLIKDNLLSKFSEQCTRMRFMSQHPRKLVTVATGQEYFATYKALECGKICMSANGEEYIC